MTEMQVTHMAGIEPSNTPKHNQNHNLKKGRQRKREKRGREREVEKERKKYYLKRQYLRNFLLIKDIEENIQNLYKPQAHTPKKNQRKLRKNTSQIS